MNGANEAAVDLFLKGKIGFNDIPRLVQQALDRIPHNKDICLDDVLMLDRMAREQVYESQERLR